MSPEANPDIRVIKREDFQSHPLLSRLLELHDVPEQIYFRGELPTITLDEYGRATPRILTIIGSRKHTTYGKLATSTLVSSLAGYNVIILSGLALGIDSIAHRGALDNNITTIAVPGSGVGRSIYPSSHRQLAEEIIHTGGLLLSELKEDAPIAKWTFPARNRIMAALSDAILVVEAGELSGTLVTARQALELGRDIGAVPGEIFSATSLGANTLIRDGAYIISTKDDLLSLLHLSKHDGESQAKKSTQSFTLEEHIILNNLNEPKEKDTLLIQSKMDPSAFLITLSSLEMKGAIEETFGEVRRIV
jgi:DNA processing protein